MHPAKSVIFFTLLSGLGLGVMNIAFAAILSGHTGSARVGLILVLGVFCLGSGLVCSLWHLGHPERAWRALSQWRSSWLSREGVMACVAFLPPLAWLGLEYLAEPLNRNLEAYLAILALIVNVVTIHCTAMIYASLKPIPAWHNGYTPLNYQLLSLMSGSIISLWLLNLYAVRPPVLYIVTALAVVLAAVAKIGYWRFLHVRKPIFNINQALGVSGDIRAFDPPHSAANYLMKEMMFDFARQRILPLQILTLLLAFVIPLLYVGLSWWGGVQFGIYFGGMAGLSMLVGLVCERWLFFACAEHSVSLYYGSRQV